MGLPEINMCELSEWKQYSLIVLYIILEAWLGRTKLVKAASLVDLLVNIVATIFRRKPKESQDDKSI